MGEKKSKLELGTTLKRAWQAALHPGSPPPLYGPLAGLFLFSVVCLFSSLAYGGWRYANDAGALFNESGTGTHLNVLLLFGGGVLALCVWKRHDVAEYRRFWLVVAIGLLYLALDDLAKVHEHIDIYIHKAFRADRGHPITDHLDDVIVLAYGPIAAVFAYKAREIILGYGWFLLMNALAVLPFSLMVVGDVFGFPIHLEESMKLLACSLISAGILSVYLTPSQAEMDGEGKMTPSGS
ncbi:MAG: hypothetical protein AAF555_09005 [Verrucomicrobiota bacterium]